MKLLVTGGCGFLGSNIAANYVKEGWEVVVVDALYRKGSEANLEWLSSQAAPGQCRHHRLDLSEHTDLEQVFRKEAPFDYICHFGGQVAMTTSLANPRWDFRTNALGTFNILESMRQFSPEAVLAYSSTNKVYGDLEDLRYVETATRFTVPEHPEGFDETLRLDFASPYGCSKGCADQYVRDWHRNFGLKTTVFRHSSIYGGRQFATFDQGWIGWFCTQAVNQLDALQRGGSPELFTIAGTGKQVRDVLHADDLVRLYRAAFENADAAAGEVFNIGGGIENSLSLLELFDLLEKVTPLPEPLRYQRLPRRQSDQNFFVANAAKANTLLGWTPKRSAESGIREMLEWVRGQA